MAIPERKSQDLAVCLSTGPDYISSVIFYLDEKTFVFDNLKGLTFD